MKLSFSTKLAVVILLVGICATPASARRLYKWVDQTRVTNYSEFQPKQGTSRQLEVLESRGNDYVDPAMAVTAEMKAIEIPVDQLSLQGLPSTTSSPQPVQQPATQTLVKQGVIAAPYPRDAPVEKKQIAGAQAGAIPEKKEEINHPLFEKTASTLTVSEKIDKKDDIAVASSEKKVQPKINPWTRTVEFIPSNLVPQNLSKASVASKID